MLAALLLNQPGLHRRRDPGDKPYRIGDRKPFHEPNVDLPSVSQTVERLLHEQEKRRKRRRYWDEVVIALIESGEI